MTIVEVLVASVVATAVMAGVLAALAPAQAAYLAHADGADARQRLRVSIDALTRDLQMASVVEARGDAIAIRQGGVERVYYLARDGQLRQDSGAAGDFPVADGISRLSAEPIDRRVRVRIAAIVRARPDLEVVFDVTPRNALPE